MIWRYWSGVSTFVDFYFLLCIFPENISSHDQNYQSFKLRLSHYGPTITVRSWKLWIKRFNFGPKMLCSYIIYYCAGSGKLQQWQTKICQSLKLQSITGHNYQSWKWLWKGIFRLKCYIPFIYYYTLFPENFSGNGPQLKITAPSIVDQS